MSAPLYVKMMDRNVYENCRLCPRNCGADRSSGITGFCGVPATLYAARAGLHFYEEPFLSGMQGSGTVFFSGCNLKCVYCQNASISLEGEGFPISEERLAEIFLEQEARGAHNLNLVTGTPYTPSIARALKEAKRQGLKMPVIWNSSAYEEPKTLALLEGLVDIWLPDFKTLSPELGTRYMKAPDYPEKAKAALTQMVRMAGPCVFTSDAEDALMCSGVVVRHLVMPGGKKDSKAVIKYLYETYGDRIWISIMSQYTPMGELPYEELNHKLDRQEYDEVVDYAIDLGVENGMIQEEDVANDSFIPIFDGTGIVK